MPSGGSTQLTSCEPAAASTAARRSTEVAAWT
jgi:hypothetical protein